MTRAATDRAYEGLKEMVVSGDLEPGDQVREEAVAERFEVSRTPVREAMRRLEVEGMLERRANRRCYVTRLDEQQMQDIFAVRATLEAMAAAHAAALADPDLTEALHAYADEGAELLTHDPVDVGRLTTLNELFHGALFDAAGNAVLARVARTLRERPRVALTLRTYTREQLARSVHHHKEIALAVAARDSAWAESVMRSHVLAAAANFRSSGG